LSARSDDSPPNGWVPGLSLTPPGHAVAIAKAEDWAKGSVFQRSLGLGGWKRKPPKFIGGEGELEGVNL